eukprot:Nk52_evm42s242 gene=Nk52_evmTU42s242
MSGLVDSEVKQKTLSGHESAGATDTKEKKKEEEEELLFEFGMVDLSSSDEDGEAEESDGVHGKKKKGKKKENEIFPHTYNAKVCEPKWFMDGGEDGSLLEKFKRGGGCDMQQFGILMLRYKYQIDWLFSEKQYEEVVQRIKGMQARGLIALTKEEEEDVWVRENKGCVGGSESGSKETVFLRASDGYRREFWEYLSGAYFKLGQWKEARKWINCVLDFLPSVLGDFAAYQAKFKIGKGIFLERENGEENVSLQDLEFDFESDILLPLQKSLFLQPTNIQSWVDLAWAYGEMRKQPVLKSRGHCLRKGNVKRLKPCECLDGLKRETRACSEEDDVALEYFIVCCLKYARGLAKSNVKYAVGFHTDVAKRKFEIINTLLGNVAPADEVDDGEDDVEDEESVETTSRQAMFQALRPAKERERFLMIERLQAEGQGGAVVSGNASQSKAKQQSDDGGLLSLGVKSGLVKGMKAGHFEECLFEYLLREDISAL